jgi:hypothetical protein
MRHQIQVQSEPHKCLNHHKKLAVYAKLKAVIFLAIANFTMFPEKEAFKSEHRLLDTKTYEHDLKDFYFVFLELEKFKYSQETIDVGIPNIDDIVFQNAYNITLTIGEGTGVGNFTKGESVYAYGNTAYGTVAYWDSPSGILKITDNVGSFANGIVVTGNTSGAFGTVVVTPDELLNPQEREMYDNKIIQTEADAFIDFSESNPFGSIT